MDRINISFFAGTDWINSDHVSDGEASLLPRIGETVQIDRGDLEPLTLPVRAVKHMFGAGQVVHILLEDNSVGVDRWIASLKS